MFNIPSFMGFDKAGSTPLLLDLYPGAAAAYSVRKLRTAYTGSAIRVRRTDLTEQNIGFTSAGNLDTTALLAFTGTGALDNGFITTWYDQSGNARNTTQTTALSQPQIVSSGSLILDNGKPCISWTTNSTMVNSSFIPSSSSGFSAFNVYSSNLAAAPDTNSMFLYSFGNSVNLRIFGKSSSTGVLSGEYIAFIRNLGTNFPADTGRLGSSNYRRNANTQVLESEFYLSSGFTFYQNNSSQNMNLTANGATTTVNWSPAVYNLTGGLIFNNFPGGTNQTNCKMQEIIFYDNSQSSNRTGIEDNINNFYSIY
jgi:hypothetical protein